MQKMFIIGNLTADPELRTTPNGVSVCNFTVAVNRRFTDANGERKADFFRVTAWRQLGETCSRYLSKGRKVSVIGEVSASTYNDKNGKAHANLELTADEVEFLSPKGEDGGHTGGSTGNAEGYQRQYGDAEASAEVTQGFDDVTDEDLPF